MKAEITEFGKQRRALLQLAALSCLAAACGSTPMVTPVREKLIRIDPGQTKATPELTIENKVRNPVIFDPPRFRFAVRECFIGQPGLLSEIKPSEVTTVLERESVFDEAEPPFRSIKMERNDQVLLGANSYVEAFEAERSLGPLGTLSSEMLSHLFIAGVFCWARRRDICGGQDWVEIERNFFSTSGLLKGSMNFVGFVNLGPTA